MKLFFNQTFFKKTAFPVFPEEKKTGILEEKKNRLPVFSEEKKQVFWKGKKTDFISVTFFCPQQKIHTPKNLRSPSYLSLLRIFDFSLRFTLGGACLFFFLE
jgi:hypothetical protein